MEKFLRSIGINKVGTYGKNDSYVVDLNDSDEFGKVFSTLDNNEELEYMDENNLLTVSNATMIYRYKDQYQVQLIADFNNDAYKLVVNEL